MQTIYIRNSRREPTGSIVLRKVDACRPQCGLPGAVFKLFLWDDWAARYRTHSTNLVTDEQGLLKVCNLRLGLYKIVELMAPDGYAPGAQRQYVVELRDSVAELTVRNHACCCPKCPHCSCGECGCCPPDECRD